MLPPGVRARILNRRTGHILGMDRVLGNEMIERENREQGEGRVGNAPSELDIEVLGRMLDKEVGGEDEYDDACYICLEEFFKEEVVMRMECGHTYHSVCIKKWLGKDRRCPVCKRDVFESVLNKY